MELRAGGGQRLLSLVEAGLVHRDLEDNIADVEQASPGQLHRVQVAFGRDQDVRPRVHLRAVEDPELRAHELRVADRAGVRSRGLSGLGLDELAYRLALLEVRLRPGGQLPNALLPTPEHRAIVSG